jgi:phage tail sheath protein FI
MAFQLSPGVNVSEFDLTTIVPAVGTTEGAIAGQFSWGPSNTVVTISNEVELADRFGPPDANNFATWFTAANFLAYARNLKVVRAANTTSDKNATSGSAGVLIENDDVYNYNFRNPFTAPINAGTIAARFAGSKGNGLRVAMFSGSQNSSAWSAWSSSTISYKNQFDAIPSTSSFVANRGGQNDEMHIIVIDEEGKFTGTPNTILEKFAFVSKAADAKNDDGSSNYYVNVINDRSKYIYILQHPTGPQTIYANVANITISQTTAYDANANGFVTFSGGSGTGANASWVANSTGQGIVITINNRGTGYISGETVSASITSPNGASTLTVTLQDEPFVSTNANWGITSSNTTFNAGPAPSYSYKLANGISNGVTDSELIMGYDKFKNAEEVDISLIMAGAANQGVAEYIVESIAGERRDCVAFISPERDDVVNNQGDEITDSIAYRNQFNSSSYAVMDSGWKYQFDKYNNVYRWVPLNGDIAGLCVRTDFERDPWYSPAGFNRGQIKNVVKLAWNPNKTARDELYKNGINPVVTFPGEGTVLYGDKTLLARPSAFDRINVRRLFIVLEKAIARAAKYSLFEFNDEFTRAQFVSLVEPYLRDVQGRRGIFQYRVVCDQTNNTPEVIDRNEFVGDIYIKPARSINFIQLNFVAVRTGVAFDEIVGKF